MGFFVQVRAREVAQLRSIHEIHLTENAQIYAVVPGPLMHTFVDNTGIMTYYEVKHLTPEEDIVYTENLRIEKEQEEQEKRAKQAAQQAEAER